MASGKEGPQSWKSKVPSVVAEVHKVVKVHYLIHAQVHSHIHAPIRSLDRIQ